MIQITEPEHATDSLRFQAELLAAVGQAIVAVDLDRVVIYWNRAAEAMYGWSADEAIGRRSTDLITRIETTEEQRRIADAMLDGRRWTGDYDVIRRDGTTFSVFVTNTPVFGRDGRLVAVIGSSVDVTERKMGEEARRQLAAIVESSGDAIFSTTVDGLVTSWNGAAERLFGYRAGEMLGQPVSILAPPGAEHEQIGMRQRLRAGCSYERLETVRRRRDGTLIDVLITASSMKDDAGCVVGLSVIAQDIADRLAAERALKASRQRLAEAQRTSGIGSFEFDVDTGRVTWSDEYYRILGLSTDVTPSRGRALSMVHAEDIAGVRTAWAASMEHGTPADQFMRIRRADGVERWVRVRTVPDLAADGTVVKVYGTMIDDTERVETERIRRAAETRFEIIFEQSEIGAVIVDLEGRPTRVNSAMCRILGRAEAELIGQRWTNYSHPDEVPLGQVVLERTAAGHDTHADERRYVRPDGKIVWVSSNVSLVRDESGVPQYFSAQLQDITDRKEIELALAHQALHDALTGLPNRVLLDDRLRQGLATSPRRGGRLGVMFLDIDEFKMINDSFGHRTGDDLLRVAAERIGAAIRAGDTVARFGGDEFVVVCDHVTPLVIDQIATRVLDALRRPWLVRNQELHIKASVGIAIADDDSTPETLLRDSDAAMYGAKQRGGGGIELFDASLRHSSERRLATASALHRALERNELSVAYQPVIDLSTGVMVSVEALLRWNHPEWGAIAPVDFIPIAEETGLIVPIGAWMIEQACRQLVAWQRIRDSQSGAARLTVAVNLSVRQLLTSDVARHLQGVLSETGVDPAYVCLELTESVFMEDVDFFGRALAGLKALGVSLAIDDFGTGYSSLSYLKRFPVDAVKVDRVFVDGLGTDPHDTALVAAIVAMAGALELDVTAEGVETVEQLTGLKALGVRRAQGYHLAYPMTADGITQLIKTAHRWYVARI
ncbi:MAG TPA: PAS domain S-box protein, partial [Ilumatobacteraceae bacterium]